MKGRDEGRGMRDERGRLMLVAVASVCFFAFSIAVCAQNVQEQPKKSNERPAASASQSPEPFDGASAEKMAKQCVKLETDAGVIEIEMLAEAAPENARNFLNLAATGLYDTTTFSRVVKDFVIQGGNLATGGKWNFETAKRAARKVPDEPSYIKHERGIVSMARPDEPNSATTHFFILMREASQLDGKFSAFRRVKSGMDVVDAINHAPVEGEKPVKTVQIKKATVEECEKKPL